MTGDPMRCPKPPGPLRRVIKRAPQGETLECGHSHENTYRQAKRRRCQLCNPSADVIDGPQRILSWPVILVDSEVASNNDLLITLRNRAFPSNEILLDPLPDSGIRCAYCHDSLDSKIVTCNLCHTILHQDCSNELGRCPTLKCGGKFKMG